MKKYVLLVLFVLPFKSCITTEDLCEIKRYADLLIPQIIYLYDQLGNPLVFNGQHVQDVNEVYYNYRTGEIFTHLFPPIWGVDVGDYLDIGTRAFNQWEDRNCEEGANAPASQTAPELSYVGDFSSGSVPLEPHYTPPIPQNYLFGGFTYTTFQLGLPGYYKVNFDANHNQAFEEHSFNNNFYNGNNGGSDIGRAPASFSFLVKEASENTRWHNLDLPTAVANTSDYGIQYDRGLTEHTYMDSPLARFMNDPEAIAKFYTWKHQHPDQAYILE